MLVSITNFIDTHSGYILATIFLMGALIKEALNFKQRKILRLKTAAELKKANLDYNEALRESYKDTAAEWKNRYEEEKNINLELIKANKTCLENIVREQEAKAKYLEEVHKLREEVHELKGILLKFQKHFPEFFTNFQKLNLDK